MQSLIYKLKSWSVLRLMDSLVFEERPYTMVVSSAKEKGYKLVALTCEPDDVTYFITKIECYK